MWNCCEVKRPTNVSFAAAAAAAVDVILNTAAAFGAVTVVV